MALCALAVHGRAEANDAEDRISLATVNANYRVALGEIARRYQREHPDTSVDITVIGQGFETWIRTRFAAGGDLIPDIFNVNYVSGYVEQGRFVFLDRYLDEINPYTGTKWRDCLDAAMLDRYMWHQRIYQIPIDFIDIALFYNADIFDELDLDIPATWEEFLGHCQAIEDAGIIPVAMPGDFDSFWAGTVGWLFRMFGDAYLRGFVPLIMSRPGDWDYESERNASYHYDPANPYSDLRVVTNKERLFNAILSGRLDAGGKEFHALHRQLKAFSDYWQPGFMGTNQESAIQLFYRQRAAMCILTSSHVTGIIRDFKRLAPEDRFRYGVFWFPPITSDPLVQGPFRGVGGAGMTLAVTQKDDAAHERRVVDFLMYLTSPEAGQLLVDMTLAAEQPLTGPFVVSGVELPADLSERFAPFEGHGYEKINFRGLADEQESVADWITICQEYFGGRLSLDDYLNEYHRQMVEAIGRLQERLNVDLDPTTEDVPEKRPIHKRLWNPFENGLLAVLVILACFGLLGAYHCRRTRGATRRRTVTAYVLLLPTFLLLGTFSYFPALSGLYHAFTRWEEGHAAVFNGLDNLRKLASDMAVWRGAGNMGILLAASVFKATVVPFVAAELLQALVRRRLRYWFRTAFLVPMVVPGMVGILIWRFIYDPSMGMLNQGLEAVGLGRWTSSWLGEPSLALPAIIFMGFPWIGALGLLIYMAGLMNIPQSVHEAYRLESDSTLRRIFSIDIPLVRGQTRLLVILAFIGSLQDFQGILIMTGGGPGLATTVPALRMYYEAFRFSNFGYGSAIGFALFVVILAITLFNMKVLKAGESPG